MRPAELIDRYLALRLSQSSPPSPTGMQLERLRLNLPSAIGDAEGRFSHYQHLVYIVEQLTDLQKRIVFAMRTPCGSRPFRREVRDGDLFLREHKNPDGTVDRWQETHAGEVFAAPSRPGWCHVEGTRPVYPTREFVAEMLGMEFDDVKREIRKAYATIDSELEKRSRQESEP